MVSLSGQLLFAWGLFEMSSIHDITSLYVLAAYQMALAVLMPNYIHRLLSTWFAMIALFWGMAQNDLYHLAKVLVAVAFVGIWMNEHIWGDKKNIFEPIAYGFSMALIQFNVHVLMGVHLFRHHSINDIGWWHLYSPWFSALIMAVLFAYVVYQLLLENNISYKSKSAQLSILGTILLMLSGTPVLGAGSSILVLLVGFSRQRKTLMALGLIALLSFMSWYYYNLQIGLLQKSVILMVGGALLLLGRWLTIRILNGKLEKSSQYLRVKFAMNKSKWVVLISLLLSIGIVNSVIIKKENVLKNGQSVLLALAPVDPRSLMQGDYMRLRFAIEREVSQFQRSQEEYKPILDGYVIVELDEHSVGKFLSFYDQGQELLANQVKMQYRTRRGTVQFATNAFFFQEGTGSVFSKAKFGEFKVAKNGELLLKSLVDEKFVVLGENLK